MEISKEVLLSIIYLYVATRFFLLCFFSEKNHEEPWKLNWTEFVLIDSLLFLQVLLELHLCPCDSHVKTLKTLICDDFFPKKKLIPWLKQTKLFLSSTKIRLCATSFLVVSNTYSTRRRVICRDLLTSDATQALRQTHVVQVEPEEQVWWLRSEKDTDSRVKRSETLSWLETSHSVWRQDVG